MPIPPLNKPATMSQRLGFQDPDLTTPEHDAMVFWTKNFIKQKTLNEAVSNTEFAFNSYIINLEKKISDLRDSAYKTDCYTPVLESTKTIIDRLQSQKSALQKINPFLHEKTIHDLHVEIHDAIKCEMMLFRNEQVDGLIQRLNRIKVEKPPIKFKSKDTADITLEFAITNPKTNFVIGYADIAFKCKCGVKCIEGSNPYNIKYELNYSTVRHFIEVKPRIQSFGELLRQIRTYETITGEDRWYVACPDTRFKDDLEDDGVKFIQITEDYKDYL